MIRLLRILAAGLAALALAGGGAPAWAAGGHGGKKTTASETFVEFGGMAATIARDYRPVGVLQIEVGLEAPDPALHERVLRLEPRLRSVCADALRLYASDRYIIGTPPDADMLADMMQEAVDDVLGQEGAELLLGTLVVHGAR